MDRNYDITDPKAIERYAQRLVGHTMAEFLPPQDLNAANKGRFGNLVEDYWWCRCRSQITATQNDSRGSACKRTPCVQYHRLHGHMQGDMGNEFFLG